MQVTHTDPLANLRTFSGAMALLDPDGKSGMKLLAADVNTSGGKQKV